MPSAKQLWWGTVVTLVTVSLAGAGIVAAAPTEGGTLTVGIDQVPPTLDPEASPSAVTYEIISDVTESLLYQDASGKILPWLATGYRVSPDGKSFTFTLRHGVTFSDGTPFDAAAVKWNFDRIVNPKYRAGAALPEITGYTGTTIVNNDTVRVNFKEPFAPFLAYVAGGALAMVSPKTPIGGNEGNTKPIGTGPFVVSENAYNDHVTLVRNPSYRGPAPWSPRSAPNAVSSIVWRIIPEAATRATTVQNGETQMISADSLPADTLSHLAALSDLRVERTPYPGVPLIWLLNVKLAPTNDLKVRQAINYGVDRAAFADSVFKGLGTPACGPLTVHTLNDPSLCRMYSYDPAKAAQLLDADGWTMGPNNTRMKDGQPLSLVINSINYGGGNLPGIDLLQGELLSLGIDAKIKSQARPPWYEDNYRCATNGPVMYLRSPDPDGLYALFDSANIGSNFNWSCYNDPEVNELLQEGRETMTPAKRRAIYDNVEHLLVEQAVSVPLIDESAVWVVRAGVSGTVYNYSGYPVLSDVVLQH